MSTDKVRKPILSDHSCASVRAFISAFQVYSLTWSGKDRKPRMIECIVPDVLADLKLKIAVRQLASDGLSAAAEPDLLPKESDSRCLIGLRAACCPAVINLQFEHFTDVILLTINEDDAVRFISDFEVRLQELAAAACPLASNKDFVQRTFVQNIRHAELRQLVEQQQPSVQEFADLKQILLRATFNLLVQQPKVLQSVACKGPKLATATVKLSCPAHPSSTSHAWEECSTNPANKLKPTPPRDSSDTARAKSVRIDPDAHNSPIKVSTACSGPNWLPVSKQQQH